MPYSRANGVDIWYEHAKRTRRRPTSKVAVFRDGPVSCEGHAVPCQLPAPVPAEVHGLSDRGEGSPRGPRQLGRREQAATSGPGS
jgi:hypothetical protein